MAISDFTNEVVVKMVTRWINEIHASSPSDVEYTLLPDTTLNSKYGIYSNIVNEFDELPVPKIMYFGLGLNGFYNVDDGNMSAPYHPAADELDLYEPIPIRCVPVDNDLSSTERANYRMRVEKIFNGARYYCYYLKKITLVDNAVKLTRTNPVNKKEGSFCCLLSPGSFSYFRLFSACSMSFLTIWPPMLPA